MSRTEIALQAGEAGIGAGFQISMARLRRQKPSTLENGSGEIATHDGLEIRRRIDNCNSCDFGRLI